MGIIEKGQVTTLESDLKAEGEKNTRRGGLNCVFKNFFVPYVEELFSGSESEVI